MLPTLFFPGQLLRAPDKHFTQAVLVLVMLRHNSIKKKVDFMPDHLFYQQEQLVSFHGLYKFKAFSIKKTPLIVYLKGRSHKSQLGWFC